MRLWRRIELEPTTLPAHANSCSCTVYPSTDYISGKQCGCAENDKWRARKRRPRLLSIYPLLTVKNNKHYRSGGGSSCGGPALATQTGTVCSYRVIRQYRAEKILKWICNFPSEDVWPMLLCFVQRAHVEKFPSACHSQSDETRSCLPLEWLHGQGDKNPSKNFTALAWQFEGDWMTVHLNSILWSV